MFNLFIQCYTKKFLQFKCRSSRKEYISFILFYSLIGGFLNVIITLSGIDIVEIVSYLFLFIQIISFLPIINLTTRRLHDIGYSGFLQLILIPIVIFIKSSWYNNIAIILGLAFCILIIFFKGTDGPNKYGPPPEY
jgi:uncharacterized membrane protein YhaH (DUF805 family)